MWDLIVSVPDHCLSFYFIATTASSNSSITAIVVSSNSSITDKTACLPTTYLTVGLGPACLLC